MNISCYIFGAQSLRRQSMIQKKWRLWTHSILNWGFRFPGPSLGVLFEYWIIALTISKTKPIPERHRSILPMLVLCNEDIQKGVMGIPQI